MSSSSQIICKPTPWFTMRAVAMLAMFSVFAVLFYIDGTTGYAKKNFGYYVQATFKPASDTFAEMNAKEDFTPEKWKEYASEQIVNFPKDKSVLPADIKLPMPWPEILTDYERMKPLQHNQLWLEYSGENELDSDPPEKPFDAGQIREQIIVFYICSALTLIALFYLIRTCRRSITADEEGIISATGNRIPYQAMKTLDLRKWDTKGIALIEYETPSGSKKARIDGFTYGGFKKEQDEPAEQLMRKIRDNFSGEIIEYTTVSENISETAPNKNA